MWDLWKEKREDQDSWLEAGCKWKWFENYLMGNAMCGQKEQAGLFILRKQLMIWIACMSFKLGEFLWLWAKAFCLFLYMILWNVCPSAPEFLPSHRGPFSRSGWADMNLAFPGSLLRRCSSGRGNISLPRTRPFSCYGDTDFSSVSSQPQRWAEMVWCGLMLLRGRSPNQLLQRHPSEASRRTGNLWIWTLRVPVHTAVICGVLQHFLEVFR